MSKDKNSKAVYVKNLKKIYRSGTEALKGIDLSVDKGDFFALLGPNGAGKSTTISIITSLARKTSGYVEVLGHNMDEEPYFAQKEIGVVPQEFNFSVFEKSINIVLSQAGFYGIPRREALQRTEHYLKKLSLWDKRNEQARYLSGGMKRRLMIARAMVHEPSILILDEPTAGVDIEIRHSMWDFIESINKELGTTIILTTHYLEEAEKFCKNIAIINSGKVMMQMPMKKLLSQLDVSTVVLDVNNLSSEQISFISDNRKFNIRNSDENTIFADICKKETLNDLFVYLAQAKIEVYSMRNEANRLESLFLNSIKKTNE